MRVKISPNFESTNFPYFILLIFRMKISPILKWSEFPLILKIENPSILKPWAVLRKIGSNTETNFFPLIFRGNFSQDFLGEFPLKFRGKKKCAQSWMPLKNQIFYFLLRIFWSTCHMIIIFSRTRRAMFKGAFRYIQHFHTVCEKVLEWLYKHFSEYSESWIP